MASRQAWCPRCDEVREARPGTGCPVCGRRLLAVPPAHPGRPQPRPLDRAARRLRALAPAAGAVGVALLIVAAVASAFAAGRLTRTTPSTPAAAPSTTVPGVLDEGPEIGRRNFNWQAKDAGFTVTLRSITVGTGFSRLELHVDGVRLGREVSALEGLRVRDADGRDLLAGGEIAHIGTTASRPAPHGGVDTEVLLDRPLDQQAVAAVELRGLAVARRVEERLRGSLVDPELQRRIEDSFEDSGWLSKRNRCPDCRLRVTCEDCRTIRVVATSYRRGRMVTVVEALDRVERTAINPSFRRVTITDDAGISELPAWIDGTGETAVISAGSDQLAATRLDHTAVGDPMTFEIVVTARAEQAVRGTWTIRKAGG